MNTREAAKWAGITYRQLDYWIAQGVITPAAEYGQGKAREFSKRDLVILRVLVMLRDDGFRIEEMREATGLINKHWVTNNPDMAGTLGVLYRGKGGWEVPRDMGLESFGEFGAYFFYSRHDLPSPWGNPFGELLPMHAPGFSYSVRRIAQEVYQELNQPSLLPEP